MDGGIEQNPAYGTARAFSLRDKREVVHPRRLEEHQEAMPYRLLGVGQCAIAHRCERVVSAVGEEAQHLFYEVALAAGGRPLDRHAHDAFQESGNQGQVEYLRDPGLSRETATPQVVREEVEDVRGQRQVLTGGPSLAGSSLNLALSDVQPGYGSLLRPLDVLLEPLGVFEVQLAGVLNPAARRASAMGAVKTSGIQGIRTSSADSQVAHGFDSLSY